MQNSLKFNESRRQEQKREVVIFKMYKKCGLKLYCISFEAVCFIRKRVFLFQKAKSFNINPQELLIN